MPYAPSLYLPSHKIMSSTCQTIHYDASQYRVYIIVIPKSQLQGPRCVLFCALTAVYCILASVLLRVPPLTFPYLPISLSPTFLLFSSPSPRCSHLPPLAPSLPSFLRPVHAYVPSSLVPFLNLPSLPPLPLPPSLTSSLPHALPLLPPSHSPIAPSLPPSLPSSILPRVAVRQLRGRASSRCSFNGPLLHSAYVLPQRISF